MPDHASLRFSQSLSMTPMLDLFGFGMHWDAARDRPQAQEAHPIASYLASPGLKLREASRRETLPPISALSRFYLNIAPQPARECWLMSTLEWPLCFGRPGKLELQANLSIGSEPSPVHVSTTTLPKLPEKCLHLWWVASLKCHVSSIHSPPPSLLKGKIGNAKVALTEQSLPHSR
jgi:hypothetical protein